MTSTQLPALHEVWLEQKRHLEASGALARFNDRVRREWAIETGVIEQIYSIDRGITKILIERGVDSSLIPHGSTDKDPDLVVAIIRDHESAIDWLFEIVSGHRPISTSFIKELHALMTQHQSTATGRDQFGRLLEVPLQRGAWKLLPNNPTRSEGSVHEYCPPEQVASEMDRLISMHEQHVDLDIPVEIQAAWLHHRFTQIHPFQDGNGRVARAIT
ncbi:MAG: Fic family protein, partial [Actinobacteria bacterium]|nr:Fic family protein [Actinomycetota bacterium]